LLVAELKMAISAADITHKDTTQLLLQCRATFLTVFTQYAKALAAKPRHG
jgi:hypothetical protein